MTEPRQKKFRSRIYREVATEDVKAGDVVVFNNMGTYTRCVESVAAKTISVKQPRGMKSKTQRVNRENVKECWRWHKRA